MTDRIALYGDSISGNCYKLQLTCAQLGIEHDWHEIDIMAGASRTPEFLALNANGKVPVARLPDGRCLAESNAILCYLADSSALFPATRFERAEILQWLFFEQYSHEPYIATSRFIVRYLGNPPERRDDLAAKRDGGERALALLESHLGRQDFMASCGYSIADIALFAYTHVADEGGFDIAGYTNLQAWLARVRAQPGFVPMRI